MRIIRVEDFPIEMSEENINILAEMLDTFPPSEEWRKISKILTYEEKKIIWDRASKIQKEKELQKEKKLTHEEREEEKRKIKESMNDEVSFRGNILEQELHMMDIEKRKKEYKTLNFKEKVKYWSSYLDAQMRRDKEYGLDPYNIFSSNWYSSIKEEEPLIDDIMEEVFLNFWRSTGGDWKKGIYKLRIKNNEKPYEISCEEFIKINKENKNNELLSIAQKRGIIVRKGEKRCFLYDEKSCQNLLKIINKR